MQAKYGPSGLLKDEIAGGASAEVFASANMEHPQALATAGKSGPVVLFARNRLCALVRPGLAVDVRDLLERMLDPAVKLGTSTPKADPSGDYAFEVFRKADKLKPGASRRWRRRRCSSPAGRRAPPPPPGRSVYGWHVAEGRADIFLTYCTGALAAQKENPGQQIVALAGRACGRRRLRADGDERRVAGRPIASRCSSCRPDGQRILAQARVRGAGAAAVRRTAMKLSARNQLKGKIVEVKKGATTAHVRIDIGGQIVTAAITNESVDELKLAPGKTAYAVIKASDVMVGDRLD